MRKLLKIFTLSLIVLNFTFSGQSKEIPGSFADLAEKLMPSVVNISTTQTVTTRSNPFPFEFPPGSPLKICLKNLVHQNKDKPVH